MNARTFMNFPPRDDTYDYLVDVQNQLLLHSGLEQDEILMLIINFRDFILKWQSNGSTEEWAGIQLGMLMKPQYLTSVRKYWERSLLQGVSEAVLPVKKFIQHHNVLDASLRYQELFFGPGDCPDWWDEVSKVAEDTTNRTGCDIGEFMETHRERLDAYWDNKMLPYHAAQCLVSLGLLDFDNQGYVNATLDTWLNDVQIQMQERFEIVPEDFQDWMQESEAYPEVLQKVRTEHHIDHGCEIIHHMITHNNLEIVH